MTSNGSSRNTAVGDIVTVSVSGDGPFGLILQPDSDGCAAVIRSWARLPNGKFGAVQKNGGVHLGDVLIAINDTKLSDMPYSEVTALLSNRNILQKSLKFQKYDEYARQKKGTRRQSSALGSTKESKNQFLSVIRQSRINNFTSAKFVEYEVVCQLRLSSGQIEKDKVFKWSVWKRYSDFEQLHGLLRQSLGWHMESIEFPSPHNFVMNKFAPDFTEQRREDLNRYWQRVIGIDKIAEFNKHHCSEALKLFLDVEGALRGGGEKPSGEEVEVMDGEGEANAEGAVPTAKKSGASSRRLSTRASSKKLSGRRGSTTGNTTAPSDDDPCASNQSVPPPTSSSTPTAAPAAVASAGAPPPPPPPRAPPPCGPPSGGGAMPPKATGARMNLLGDINKLRKE